MWLLIRTLASAPLLALSGCGWKEWVGDFAYTCQSSVHPLDRPFCEHRLGNHYLLRYGEGSGDQVVLEYEIDGLGGGALINESTDDVVRRIGLDDQILVAQTGDGRIFVAPLRFERRPEVVGPLSAEEFTARYPNAPAWREVQ